MCLRKNSRVMTSGGEVVAPLPSQAHCGPNLLRVHCGRTQMISWPIEFVGFSVICWFYDTDFCEIDKGGKFLILRLVYTVYNKQQMSMTKPILEHGIFSKAKKRKIMMFPRRCSSGSSKHQLG